MSRVGIVVIAALMVEIISIAQYERVSNMISEEMETRSQVVMGSMARDIEHLLHITETTMSENLWDVQRSIDNPDSVFPAMMRLIDDNPNVVGGCLAFVPDYYPSKGRLFEPFASKQGDTIVVSQIAGAEHDYTHNKEFQQVVQTLEPAWTDPYFYGPDSLKLATYSYPILDRRERLAAVCGLDINLSWLGDTLNAHQPSPSSFGLLLTADGDLVAGPSESRTSPEDVLRVLTAISEGLETSSVDGFSINSTTLENEPHWHLVQVYRTDEMFARMRRMRLQNMLFIIAGLAILAFMINRFSRNEKKLRNAVEQNARISGELQVASEIQQSMLPHHHLEQEDIDIRGLLVPAREVGGDLYDYFIRDDKLFFCIGDVSGKGAPAALLMAVTHSKFRSASTYESNPARIMQVINESSCQNNDNNMFVTLFIGVLDLPTGILRYCDAGHDSPIILESDGLRIEKCRPNLPVGVFEDTAYSLQETTLASDSTVFLYTDGLTEAKDVDHGLYGLKRVEGVLGRCAQRRLSPEQIISTVSESLQGFTGDAVQSDDLTMLCFHYTQKKFESEVTKTLVIKNSVSEVSRLSDFMKPYPREVRLAVEEAVVNVIDYAYPEGIEGDIEIRLMSDTRSLRVQIIDAGVPFDPTAKAKVDTSLPAEERQIGGLGILLVRELMDSINYERIDGKNILTLTKKL